MRLVAGDPQSVVIRFFDELGADISETTARKIERTFYREDFRRVFPGDIGDIGFPPRALEYYTAALIDAIDTAAIRGDGVQGRRRLRLRHHLVRDAERAGQARRRRAGGQPLRVHAGRHRLRPRRAHAVDVADLVRSSGAHLGAVIDPDGEHITLIDDEGHVLTDTEALLAFVDPASARRPTPGCRDRRAGRGAAPRSAEIAAEHGRRGRLDRSSPTPALMDVGAVSDDVVFAGQLDGGFIFPRFLPAFDAMAAFAKMLELLARTGTRLSKVVGTLPAHPRRARDGGARRGSRRAR